MAWQLFRLGRWSFIHRQVVAGIWVVALAVVGVGAATLSGTTSDDFELSGIESTEAFDLIADRAPKAAPDGATARVVFEAPGGQSLTDPPHRRALTEALTELDSADVVSVADPFTSDAVSRDGRVAYATVSFARAADDLTAADIGALEAVRDAADAAGLGVTIGGDALGEASHPPLAELVGIGIALLVLALTLGSLVAAGMSLMTAIVGVGLGLLVITAASGLIELSSTTPALGTMLGLAVGIDYALFIMSRYQHEVRRGHSLQEAAGRAVGTAGSAVVFAGLTVIIALAGLAVCRISFLTQMGLAGALMVALAVLIALTLLPAVLGFAGHRAAGRVGREAPRPPVRTLGRRWIDAVGRFRWLALVAGVAAAAAMSVPVASMELALPDDSTKPADSDARIAYQRIADNFGEGVNGPLVVVVDTIHAADPAAAVAATTEAVEALAERDDSPVAAVVPAVADDTPEAHEALEQQLRAVGFANLTVIPTTGPSAPETKALVADLRHATTDVEHRTGARVLVTGQTAVGVDIANELSDAFPLYLLVVVGLAVVLLIAVFRSILVPLKAALGFLLSVGVSLGATVMVFQWGWAQQLIGLDVESPVVFLLPILLTGILFGLAMDYEVFLVTRMREAHVHGAPARQAVVDGFVHSARVVAAAAVIMIGVFAGFAFTDDVILKTIGFSLAIGVLADAFLVRMLIVPALMMIAGERIWWMPTWLAPLVPTVDVEGEGLARRLDAPTTHATGSD